MRHVDSLLVAIDLMETSVGDDEITCLALGFFGHLVRGIRDRRRLVDGLACYTDVGT